MGNVLGRGWSPTTRRYRFLRFALAVLLFSSPALVYVSGYGQPNYRYEAVEIRPADGGFEYDRDVSFVEGLEGVSCYGWERSRLCLLEGDLVDENRTYEDPPGIYDPPEERYTYQNGQFYERIREGKYDTVVLGLRPVSSAKVLDAIARDIEHLDQPLQRVVRDGARTVHRDLDATGRVVRYDGSYYAVHLTEHSESGSYIPSVFGFLAGFGLLARGVRDELRE
ncbi:hypothetical protein SAMN05216559_1272 [Halomicrobium zhouii]|uniref:Uncharacterized protein n=1 Tax=Halomicrobium zhouii TaxID=767519 RepID=A0A1I6KQZ6_9EURY|nr:hypothetical protein [Halomicrobium zhouii]SFR93330.1 hypothetical protein SAMN05216559_1272 [Halomicrobium zhouii]